MMRNRLQRRRLEVDVETPAGSAIVMGSERSNEATVEISLFSAWPSRFPSSSHAHTISTNPGCELTSTAHSSAHTGPHSWSPCAPATDMECVEDNHGGSSPLPPAGYSDSYDSQKINVRLKSTWEPFSILLNAITSSSHGLFTLPAKSSTLTILVCLLMTFLATPSTAFNLDLKTAVIHKGAEGSMFGYSVAQHVDQSTNWLLIGAPKAQTRQKDVEKGGAVFRCKTDRVNSCQAVPFDNKENNLKYNGSLNEYFPTEEKSNQWFGATIESSGESGVIVACAPRYIYFGEDLKKKEPVGRCWVAKTSTTEYESYSPCARAVDRSTAIDQYHRQGFCHFGFSATFANDGRRLMIAAPGSWYWQGQMFVYDAVTGKPRYTNREGHSDTDYWYRGYSSAIGRFDADDEDDYVVGTPKGNNYVGMVELYTQSMTRLGTIIGEQIGSYFGGTVAVTDLNGDRLDDIIVGAPLFTNFNNSNTFDSGRVYIYYQSKSHTFPDSKRDILDGMSSQSRFGMALSGLGDINYDGYDDLCIGAPYAGEDKKGAIYIYHGSKEGIITEVSQIVYASDFKSPLATFGASISAGIDQDKNLYPDVLVGAYDSDRAVFMRSRPVVKVFVDLALEPAKVKLEERSCTLYDGTQVTCINMTSCFKYTGVGLPDELYFDLEWILDAKEGNNTSRSEQRAFYIKNQQPSEKKTVKIRRDNSFCVHSNAYVKNNPADKLSPIRTHLGFKLNLKEEEQNSRSKRDLQPILDKYIPTHTSFTTQISKNCGDDEICIPNLFVTCISVDLKHTAGSKEELEILIIVGNNGEDSFNTKLFIEMPPGIDYSGKSGERSEVPISCDPLEDGSHFVVCNLGNPMTAGSESQFTFRVKPTNSNDTKDILKFHLHVNSSNPEHSDTYFDNEVPFEIEVTTDTQIKLFGTANPEHLNVTDQDIKSDGKGKLIRHVYQLSSHGISPINETELQIRWPSTDSTGRPALVLDGPLNVVGNGKCEIIIIGPNNATRLMGYAKEDYNSIYGYNTEDKNTQDIRCSHEHCTIIQCLVGYMSPYSSFSLTIYSRLKIRSFIKGRKEIDDDINMYNLVSVGNARVRSVPYDFKNVDKSKFPTKRCELTTKLNTESYAEGGQKIAVWIYAVAITVGILMLLILILLLWCCGFFKRKKHEDDDGYHAVNGKNDIDSKYMD